MDGRGADGVIGLGLGARGAVGVVEVGDAEGVGVVSLREE